jgi:Fic family protein
MSDLEKFANDELNAMPDLLKIALIHYQFETVHPFLDGNGRVGRLLITLYLVSKGILKQPILYLSDFFERNRALYYDNLMRVRTHNDLSQWFKFFLTGVIETARHGVLTFDGIMQLQKNMDITLSELGSRKVDAQNVLQQLYTNPILDVDVIQRVTGKALASAYRLLNDLSDLGIVKEMTGTQRNKKYVFKSYIDLFNNGL